MMCVTNWDEATYPINDLERTRDKSHEDSRVRVEMSQGTNVHRDRFEVRHEMITIRDVLDQEERLDRSRGETTSEVQ